MFAVIATDDTVIAAVRSIESIAIKQFQQHCQDVLTSKKKSIHDSIKKNSLPTFMTAGTLEYD